MSNDAVASPSSLQLSTCSLLADEIARYPVYTSPAYDLLDRDLAIKPMSEWQAVELSDIPSYRARSEDEALSM